MRKIYAIVCVECGIHEPEKLEWEVLLRKYGEAVYVMRLRADMLAAQISRTLSSTLPQQ